MTDVSRDSRTASPYPRDLTERAAIREEILRKELAKARREAIIIGRSLKCSGGTYPSLSHAGEPGGCRNNGYGCICECHDAIDAEEAS